MLRFLLCYSFAMLTTCLLGQRGTVGSTITSDLAVERLPYGIAKGVPEVIEPPFAGLACASSVSVINLSEPGEGFVTGTNNFADLAKGQRFIYEAGRPYEVLEIGVAFFNVDSAALDSTVTVQIYNDLGSDGSFGSLVGTSEPVALRDITLPDSLVRYTVFTFADSVVVNRDSFIAVVNLSGTYTASPQYMSLFSTDAGCGDGSNAFEFFLDQDNELRVATIQDNWEIQQGVPLNIEFIMLATVEPLEVTSVSQSSIDYAARVFPNPTDGSAELTFVTRAAGSYRISLLDLTGRTLQTRINHYATGESARTQYDLTALPAGVYLYRIEGPGGVQQERVVKR